MVGDRVGNLSTPPRVASQYKTVEAKRRAREVRKVDVGKKSIKGDKPARQHPNFPKCSLHFC
jgi:hypothetical protein